VFIWVGYSQSMNDSRGKCEPRADLGGRTHVASRHVIDLALGILMGLRGCSQKEAFDELVAAVHDTGIGPGTLARALVDLVEDSGAPPVPHRYDASQRWGYLLAPR
jgi:hypothetical protein